MNSVSKWSSVTDLTLEDLVSASFFEGPRMVENGYGLTEARYLIEESIPRVVITILV